MPIKKFTLTETCGLQHWLEHDGNRILLCRDDQNCSPSRRNLGVLDRDRIWDLVQWATADNTVTAMFEGPMAVEIKKTSDQLGISEQMVIWNAVKLFLEVGEREP